MGLGEYFVQNPLVFNIIVLMISFLILTKASDFLVYGISRYAKILGLSDLIVGLLIVSIAASVPELSSSVMGLASGDTGIIFGTLLGSNLAELTLVLGIFALVGRRLKLKNTLMKNTEPVMFILITLPFILVADGKLARTDGIMLLMAYAGYVGFLWRRESRKGALKKDINLKIVWQDALIFSIALATILLSAIFLVDSSIKIAKMMNIPSFLMAIVVLGIGGSIPDITVGIRAVLQGHQDVGLGNFLGSVTVISLLFFGILSIIRPLTIEIDLVITAMVFTLFALGFVLYLSEKEAMNWRHGVFLIFIYIAFIIIELMRNRG